MKEEPPHPLISHIWRWASSGFFIDYRYFYQSPPKYENTTKVSYLLLITLSNGLYNSMVKSIQRSINVPATDNLLICVIRSLTQISFVEEGSKLPFHLRPHYPVFLHPSPHSRRIQKDSFTGGGIGSPTLRSSGGRTGHKGIFCTIFVVIKASGNLPYVL